MHKSRKTHHTGNKILKKINGHWVAVLCGLTLFAAAPLVNPETAAAQTSEETVQVYNETSSSSFDSKESYLETPLVQEEVRQVIENSPNEWTTKTSEEIGQEIQRQQDLGLTVYVIQWGDTVPAIAEAIGVDASELASWNGLDDSSQIIAGDILTLEDPAAAPTETAQPTANDSAELPAEAPAFEEDDRADFEDDNSNDDAPSESDREDDDVNEESPSDNDNDDDNSPSEEDDMNGENPSEDNAENDDSNDDTPSEDNPEEDDSNDDTPSDDNPEDDDSNDDIPSDDNPEDDGSSDVTPSDDNPEEDDSNDDTPSDDNLEDDESNDDTPSEDNSEDDGSNDDTPSDDNPEEDGSNDDPAPSEPTPEEPEEDNSIGFNSSLVQDLIFGLVNTHRANNGLQELVQAASLQAGAELRAQEMADYGDIRYVDENGTQHAHTRPDGSSWSTAFDEYQGSLGENIAQVSVSSGYGFLPEEEVAQRLFDSWVGSAGHNAQMLNPEYNSLAVGVAYGDDTLAYPGEMENYIGVQIFGSQVEAAPEATLTTTADNAEWAAEEPFEPVLDQAEPVEPVYEEAVIVEEAAIIDVAEPAAEQEFYAEPVMEEAPVEAAAAAPAAEIPAGE